MSSIIEIPNACFESMSICNKHRIVSLAGKRSSVIVSYRDGLKVVQRILDEHPDENFQCSEFFMAGNDISLALGGKLGIIKMVNLSKGTFIGHIKAHGGSISSIKRYKDKYLLSCSEDTTIKMWDISELACVCIFGGYSGHRDYVLSIDVSNDMRYLASCGTDCSIKIWRIPSYLNKLECTTPIYSSTHECRFPIECIRFYGELLVFYSGEKRIHVISLKYEESKSSAEALLAGEIILEERLLRKFDISGSTLVALIESQDVIMFDMNDIGFRSHPKTLKSFKRKKVQDFCAVGDQIFILLEDSRFMTMDLT
ncbi:WD40 domain-binding protein [Encephalitozoon romaleae SJ-2008]|uniref:WD40 domain-binding protein n=1 Tax=Encephalitozoon romaleae (strain SJ-2008) TaxID=1178016 RepID=I6ZKH4_ENCRO|nr:WD40 domain-binding protein [Encephalitozoon romaleae SJ-2008]AFN83793.1 WD40 domain-binding protein [Encephalitozoon romaleae SJ-2008]